MAASTGSWSKPFSRIVSVAVERGSVEVIVVTGLRRRVRIVAPAKGSFGKEEEGEGGAVGGGLGGRRSLAASQSSSTNFCCVGGFIRFGILGVEG